MRAPPAPEESFAATMTDGVEILVRRYGIGRGPCLAITHGNGFAVDGYRVFWEPLAERFELALFDMRNHGRNRPSGADGHHYQQMARDLDALQRAIRARLSGRPVVGVFHSMSARAAMKQCVEIGPGWDAVILFDPPSVPPPEHRLHEAMREFELKLVNWAASRPDRFDAVEGQISAYRESRASSRWLPEAIEDMGHAVLRQLEGQAGWTLSCRRELEASIYLAALTLDLWPAAAAMGAPTKLLGADPALRGNPPTGVANQALAAEQGYVYEFIPQAGHLLQIEHPEACRAAMIGFLEECGIV